MKFTLKLVSVPVVAWIVGFGGQVYGSGILNEVSVPVKSCPPGFELMGKGCIRMEKKNIDTICPKNMNYINGKCMGKRNVEGKEVCPPGFIRKGHRCESEEVQPVDLECSHGYILANGACVRESKTPANSHCPKGFSRTVDGRCYVEVEGPTQLACSVGYALEGGNCVAIEEAMPMVNCGIGFTLSNGKCEKVRTKRVKLVCPPHFRYDDTHNACTTIRKVPANEICPQNTFREHGHCVYRKETIPALMCTDGFQLVDGRCLRTVEEKPRLVCDKSSKLIDNKCVLHIKEKARINCPQGYHLVKHSCEKLELAKVQHECPHGSMLRNGECQMVDVREPEQTCPRGFEFTDKGCKKMIIEKPVVECMGEKSSHGKCIDYKYVSPVVKCPKDHSLLGNDCVKLDKKQPSEKCQHGYHHRFGRCIRTTVAKPTLLCPNGADEHGKCLEIVVKDPEFQCPHGFTFRNHECVSIEQADVIFECPIGYKFSQNQCIVDVIVGKDHKIRSKKLKRIEKNDFKLNLFDNDHHIKKIRSGGATAVGFSKGGEPLFEEPLLRTTSKGEGLNIFNGDKHLFDKGPIILGSKSV